ncbi:unnamed protein product [Schistocephalus solidus]|uniref:Metalloendopeptidase n=1 Tax=Schistocephalus solidus TaxID=70667 RepID=A0A183TEC5_SCHSO|nr:unnamed protein product [Schistocephalus solidus]
MSCIPSFRRAVHFMFMLLNLNQIRCCSFVGRQSDRQPQKISIAPDCKSEGTVLHELAHALGFWHEQSRPDRDNYVNISFANIQPHNLHNFEKKTEHEVDSLGEPYDYNSIMHYDNFAFTKDAAEETLTPLSCCPRPNIGQRQTPSVGDVKQMNRLYKCPCIILHYQVVDVYRAVTFIRPSLFKACGQTFVEPTGRFSYPSVDALHASADATDKNIQLEMPTYLRRSPGTAYPSQSEGQILSATSSNSHPLYCRWRVLARRGERIVFKFLRMGLLPPSNGNNCSEEYVEVRDGYNSTSHLIG